MVDVARLGLAVDSSQVEKGTVSLHQLTGAAGQASVAAQRLAGASQTEAAGQKVATVATQAHTAALHANNAAMRMNGHVRTNMIYQLNDVGVSLASGMNPLMVAIQQIPQMLQFGLKPALESIAGVAKGLVTSLWPVTLAVGAVVATLGGLTYEINKTAETQVSMIDVALAAWGMFADQVAAIVGPVWEWLVDGLQWVWDQMAPILKNIGNGIIRPFAFGVEAIGILWQKLPAAIGDAMITTANVIIKGIEWSINGATRLLNGFLEKYNEGLSAMGQQTIPLAPGFTIPQAANPYQGALGQLGSGLESANLRANSTDFMGGMFGGLSERAQEIAAARQEMDALGGSAKAANDNVKSLADDGLKSAADRAQELANNLGKSIGGALKDLISGTKDFGQVMVDVLGNVAQFAFQQASSIFGGMGGGMGFFGSILSGLFGGGFASGGVFSGGHVQPFARGGIVNSPTLFPMANGAGLMGEAGPEAIMPLRRGADGKLGVAANSNGGGSMHVSVGVTVDDEGKLQAYVKSVSRQEAQSAAAIGTQVAVAQANKTAPASVANYQKQRAGSDYRTM